MQVKFSMYLVALLLCGCPSESVSWIDITVLTADGGTVKLHCPQHSKPLYGAHGRECYIRAIIAQEE